VGAVVFVLVVMVMSMFKRGSSAQHSTPHVSAARQSCGVVKPEHAALRWATAAPAFDTRLLFGARSPQITTSWLATIACAK
jgi:hypothetical protein